MKSEFRNHRFLIRFFDVILSLVGISVFLLPALFIAIAIRVDSKGPAIFRQIRIGKKGREFSLLKFRTMIQNASSSGLITVGSRDPRITVVGAFLRKYKLDELPQLINVLKGEMSFVGPRPEVKKYVDMYTPEQKIVLSIPPGITDMASIRYSNENEVLAACSDPDKYYINVLVPAKIRLNMVFIERPTLTNYFSIIFATILKIFGVRQGQEDLKN
ncbi:MAG: sugar transferase [Bacteroidetes bacterium]|nr:MAG: sugar transferase [Bacteroidota bacterium]REJ99678.1 MAG: sugar transferase [Bacteroidota bacterium]REK33911.1 MAG: sugar transferase [Bacteroidota bacterium]REK47676.1 MAG: sugar transferase [Bacteroidota bacterium]